MERKYSTEEVGARGREIYDRQLKSKLEPQNVGKFLVIDVETGDYEIGDDDYAVSIRAFNKKPNGARYGMRIGHAATGTIGNALSSAPS